MRGLKYYSFFDSDSFLIRRTSHEVRGLKFRKSGKVLKMGGGRTSHEVRGLKLFEIINELNKIEVAPHTRCVD